ncbi:hypothetical protein BKA69DRAFT_1041825 [Paraphysoderma sedebokerense]|nr:hypothetical protein BKA69DRAFT_1041825 [Paraphysoderma sedebokerense]
MVHEKESTPSHDELVALAAPYSSVVFEHSFANQPHARTLLLAVDESKHSRYSYQWVIQHMLRKEDELVIVNVRKACGANPSRGMSDGEFLDVWRQLEDQSRERSHSLLRSYGMDLKERGYNVRAISIRGEPRHELIAKAHSINADAIIMGSRGLSPIKRVFMGSISNYVSTHADIPVIIVRPPKGHEAYEHQEMDKMEVTDNSDEGEIVSAL